MLSLFVLFKVNSGKHPCITPAFTTAERLVGILMREGLLR